MRLVIHYQKQSQPVDCTTGYTIGQIVQALKETLDLPDDWDRVTYLQDAPQTWDTLVFDGMDITILHIPY